MHRGARVDAWRALLTEGPSGLTQELYHRFDLKLEPDDRTILSAFLAQMAEDKKWILERTAAMRDESERIALIGHTMQRAGLRSYTDKDGQIFVAEDRTAAATSEKK